jgi:multiple sugar transport system ATP-binding protein
MNLIPVAVSGDVIAAEGVPARAHPGPRPQGPRAILGLRPEKLRLGAPDAGRIQARVAVRERLGAESIVGCSLSFDEVRHDRLMETDLIFVRMAESPDIRAGAPCTLDYDDADATWFDEATGRRIELDRTPADERTER